MLVDLNGYVRDRMRVGITGAFGVPGEIVMYDEDSKLF